MRIESTQAPSGKLGVSVIKAGTSTPKPVESLTAVPAKELSFSEFCRHGLPQRGLSEEVNRWRRANLPNLWRGFKKVMAARALGVPHFYGQLSLVKIAADGTVTDYGLASWRVVTTAGVNFIVDAFQNSEELELMEFHGIGTGNTAEAVGDTALVTELTTEYNPNSTRATGTNTEGGGANVYRTVGTNSVDASAAIEEHGIFDQASTAGGTLLDRTVFSVVNLSNGDSLQTTYDLTFTAGS